MNHSYSETKSGTECAEIEKHFPTIITPLQWKTVHHVLIMFYRSSSRPDGKPFFQMLLRSAFFVDYTLKTILLVTP
jgi:hypothetical protein